MRALRSSRSFAASLVVAVFLVIFAIPVACFAADNSSTIYVNQAAATFYARVNCKVPAWKHGYPCLDPGGTVAGMVDQVSNRLAVDPECHGLQFTTEPAKSHDDQEEYWELRLDIPFGDEIAPINWSLWKPGNKAVLGARGDDSPKELVHIVCGVVSHRGAERMP